jgi:hypothetical protein
MEIPFAEDAIRTFVHHSTQACTGTLGTISSEVKSPVREADFPPFLTAEVRNA